VAGVATGVCPSRPRLEYGVESHHLEKPPWKYYGKDFSRHSRSATMTESDGPGSERGRAFVCGARFPTRTGSMRCIGLLI